MDWSRKIQEIGIYGEVLVVFQVGGEGGLNWESGEEEEAIDGEKEIEEVRVIGFGN